MSTISSLFSILTISEVFTILLISSWLSVALLVPSGMALLLCSTMFGTMDFSKYWKRTLLSSLIQISRSRVGNTPLNMSSVSIVRVSQPQIPFMTSCSISVVFCKDDIPACFSSCLHFVLNLSSPSTILHPSLTACNHTLISSI